MNTLNDFDSVDLYLDKLFQILGKYYNPEIRQNLNCDKIFKFSQLMDVASSTIVHYIENEYKKYYVTDKNEGNPEELIRKLKDRFTKEFDGISLEEGMRIYMLFENACGRLEIIDYGSDEKSKLARDATINALTDIFSEIDLMKLSPIINANTNPQPFTGEGYRGENPQEFITSGYPYNNPDDNKPKGNEPDGR